MEYVNRRKGSSGGQSKWPRSRVDNRVNLNEMVSDSPKHVLVTFLGIEERNEKKSVL